MYMYSCVFSTRSTKSLQDVMQSANKRQRAALSIFASTAWTGFQLVHGPFGGFGEEKRKDAKKGRPLNPGLSCSILHLPLGRWSLSECQVSMKEKTTSLKLHQLLWSPVEVVSSHYYLIDAVLLYTDACTFDKSQENLIKCSGLAFEKVNKYETRYSWFQLWPDLPEKSFWCQILFSENNFHGNENMFAVIGVPPLIVYSSCKTAILIKHRWIHHQYIKKKIVALSNNAEKKIDWQWALAKCFTASQQYNSVGQHTKRRCSRPFCLRSPWWNEINGYKLFGKLALDFVHSRVPNSSGTLAF